MTSLLLNLTMMRMIRLLSNLLQGRRTVQKLKKAKLVLEKQLRQICTCLVSPHEPLHIRLCKYDITFFPKASQCFSPFRQLALALSDAPTWCSEHNGLNFHHMYDAIIDYFEDVSNPSKKIRCQQLLEWWNRCVVFDITNHNTACSARCSPI